MAFFRGRGGRGRGGFGYGGYAKQEKFELFPEIKELPAVNYEEKEKEFGALVKWSADLQKFWKLSPYNYEGMHKDAERKRAPLSDFIKMTSDYVPAELGARNDPGHKRPRWNPEKSVVDTRLDFYEKLDLRSQTQKEDEKDNKEDEEEDEDNVVEEEDEESDDYEQNIDFDDDEDDFNMADDGGDDEGYY